jgi:hypothetical protein
VCNTDAKDVATAVCVSIPKRSIKVGRTIHTPPPKRDTNKPIINPSKGSKNKFISNMFYTSFSIISVLK